jgi:RNA polymerase sigma-70 factor (sigma-E family)
MQRRQRDAEFSAFVEVRRAALVRTAYLLSGDWHRAEDLVQQALVRLYRAWPRVGAQGGEDAYLRRALVSSNIDDWRWRSRRPETLVAEHSDTAGAGTGDLSDREALRQALMQLTDNQRRVVVLRFWLDQSVEETAADLGVSSGTVKSQTSRALLRLRTIMHPDDDFAADIPESTPPA